MSRSEDGRHDGWKYVERLYHVTAAITDNGQLSVYVSASSLAQQTSLDTVQVPTA